MESFQEWCLAQGCKFPRVGVCDDIPGFGGGIVAREDVPPGYDAVVIPLDLLISVPTVKASELYPILHSLAVTFVSDFELLYVFLVYERNKRERSRWHPYFRQLPDRFDTPLFASDSVLRCCKGTNLLNEVIKIRKSILKLSQKMVVVGQARPDLGSFSYDALLWACGLIMSRALSVLDRDNWPQGCVVPLADMMNHSGAAEVQYLTHPDEGCFSIRLVRGAKKDDQVFLNYGSRNEEKMLLNYGFCEKNEYFVRSLTLKAGLSEDDPFYARKTDLLKKLNKDFQLYITETDVDSALNVIKILVASSELEMKALEMDLSYCTLRNEFGALEALGAQLEDVLTRLSQRKQSVKSDILSDLHQSLSDYATGQLDLCLKAQELLDEKMAEVLRKNRGGNVDCEVVPSNVTGLVQLKHCEFVRMQKSGVVCARRTGLREDAAEIRIPRSGLVPAEKVQEVIDGKHEGWADFIEWQKGVFAALKPEDELFADFLLRMCGLEDEEENYFLSQCLCIPFYPPPQFHDEAIVFIYEGEEKLIYPFEPGSDLLELWQKDKYVHESKACVGFLIDSDNVVLGAEGYENTVDAQKVRDFLQSDKLFAFVKGAINKE